MFCGIDLLISKQVDWPRREMPGLVNCLQGQIVVERTGSLLLMRVGEINGADRSTEDILLTCMPPYERPPPCCATVAQVARQAGLGRLLPWPAHSVASQRHQPCIALGCVNSEHLSLLSSAGTLTPGP